MKQILMFVFGVPEELPPMMNESRSLADRGYRVRILGIRRSRKHQGTSHEEGVFIHRMFLYSRYIVGDGDTFEIVRYGEAVLRGLILGIFRRASLIVAHDLVTLPQAYVLALLKRTPIVYRAHELWAEQKPSFPRAAFWKRLDRFFVPRVDLLVAPEPNRAAIYKKEYCAVHEPVVIFNCTRLLPLPSGGIYARRQMFPGIADPFIVYYQGGISRDRMIDNLILAMKLVPENAVLVLVGRMDAEFAAWYADVGREKGLAGRIVHLGHIPYGKELFELCAGAHAGVMFVAGDCRNNIYNVTAANKVFEYMMMGIPIITVAFPAHKAFVEGHGIGRCVEAGDPTAIARVITELSAARDTASAMGSKARRLAETEYNWENQARTLLREYEKLIPAAERIPTQPL